MATQKLQLIMDAFPRGDQPYRHWLSRRWSDDGQTALVIAINPNTATDSKDDDTTRFLVRTLRQLDGEFACGGYILVNCCDRRSGKPEELERLPMPSSPGNLETIRQKLQECDFVAASWGTGKYGGPVPEMRQRVAELMRESGKRVISFHPEGSPIYCSQRNKNSKGRWSSTPVLWNGEV